MSKHTPGPWSVDDYGAGQRIVVKGRKGFTGDYRVADAHFSSDLVHCVRVAEMRANARLIAAAPELLSAIIDLADAARSACNAAQHSALVQALFDADYAIAKANGVAK